MKTFLIKENFTSINLFNKIGLLTESQAVQIAGGIEWTIDNYPDAVIIGGTALIHYMKNSRELTPDIDFMINDIGKLKDLLENDNISYSLLRSTNEIIGITVDLFNTDYLDSSTINSTLNRMVISTAKTTMIGGFNVKIIAPELLAIMKLELGRDKDIKDGFALIQSGVLSRNTYLKYLDVLKNSLADYDSIKGYSEMIFNM